MNGSDFNNGGRIRSLDGLRALAVGGVLVDHFVSARLINLGRLGVEVFFVLSGVLMSRILFERGTPFSTYVPRRLSRTYPALLVFATCVFVADRLFSFNSVTLSAYLAALTSTANYYSIYVERTLPLDNLWSLCIEEHVYILLALIALVQRKFGIPPTVFLVLLAALAFLNGIYLTVVLGRDYYDVFWRTDVRGASILIGAAVSLQRNLLRTHTVSIFFASAAAALLLNVNIVPDYIKYSLGTFLIAISVINLSIAPQWLDGWLNSRTLVAIGLGSYSLYLWQQPFAQAGTRLLRLASLPLVLVISAASFYVVERPCRRHLNRLFTGSRPPELGV